MLDLFPPNLDAVTNVEDLRAIARRRVPMAVFEYADHGAYDELTLAANRAAFQRRELVPRVMTDVGQRRLETTIAGEPAALPLAIAPTGLAGLNWPDGEIHAARAAHRCGIPYCLSTMSICSIEDVREAAGVPFWFQLYVFRDRGFSRSLIDRAREAQCPVMVLTADLPIQGQRHRDIKNGLAVPPRLTAATLLDLARRPRWVAGVLLGRRKSFGNLEGRIAKADNLRTLAAWIAEQFDPTLNWSDLEWIRARWPGKLVLKGVMSVDDAKLAVANGIDSLIVSNHGGRQLDGAPAALDVLPAIVEAAGDRCEVLFDSGIRSGQDVLKALALGARACFIGRAFLYGLGAAGEAGVVKVIDIIRRELDVTLGLVGLRSVHDLTPEVFARVTTHAD
jgi:L-lactate dehydrogenase (cytochrome)